MKKRILLLMTLTALFTVSAIKAQGIKIKDWLIAGSFSSDKDPNQHAVSFFDESNAVPQEGMKVGNVVWKKVTGPVVDFTMQGYTKIGDCAAYAFTYVYSKQDQLVTILLGSDDGNIVWLNGNKVWDKVAQRPMTENEDVINAQLVKGWNRLLIKVDQGNGGWGMVCNMTSTDVNLALSYPANEGLAKNKDVTFTRFDVSKIEKGKASVILGVVNFSGNNAENIKCILGDASGKSIAQTIFKSIPAGGIASSTITVPLTDLCRFLSKSDAEVTLMTKEASHIVVGGTFLNDLLLSICKDKTLADAETQSLAYGVEKAAMVYGLNGDFTALSRKGLEYVADKNMAYVKPVLMEMQKMVMTNAPDLSNDKIHIVGHAHMDMNWLWPYSETRKMMHDNFRQVCAFMEQFPDYHMLQSQVTIYKHIEKMDPPLFEKVKKYVKEGRFETVGGMWSEGDCNLTGGEALCRSFMLGQRYYNERFNQIAHVGWLPDNFGHISQMPQILKSAGCDYYYFMRCTPYSGTFWWKGPDSSTVLCFSGNSYNNAISPAIKNDVGSLSPKSRRIFVPTGVGDHGGGPTLKDIQTAHMLDSTPRFCKVKFTRAEDFFKESSKEMDGRPTHRGEMQFIFEGCYTSIAEIKENTRRSEQSLYKAEYLSSLRWLFGESYPATDLKDAWETVCYNQFHDILPGSAIYETYRDAVADHNGVQKKANEIAETGFLHLADEVAFKTGMGYPIVVVNMQPRGKKVLVEAEIFTHEQPVTATLSSWGDYYAYGYVTPVRATTSTVLVRDNNGKAYPAQITGGKIFPPGYRSRIQFVVDNMPAGGYKTFYVDATQPGVTTQEIAQKDGKFETDFFTVAVDMKTGDIIQLKDKRSGKDYVSANGRLNKLRMYMEAPNGMNAWTIGEIKNIEEVTDVESVKIIERGPVRATIEVVKKWGHSKFVQRTYIYKSYPRIDFDLDAHWFEVGDGSKATNPFLKTTFDLAIDNPTFYNHVPFDAIKRPTNGQEVPAQQWVDVTDGKAGIALLNKTKFGHSFENGQLKLSLLRATYSPCIYPNIGVNHIQYSLYPHTGDWTNGVWAEADNFNVPVYAAEPPSLSLVKTHATRPAEDSLFIVSPSQVVMSGIKQAEDGKNLIIRVAEVTGKETMATITLPVNAKSASRVRITEFPQENAENPIVSGKKISVKLKAHEIATLSVVVN